MFDVGIANLSLVGYLFPHWRRQALALAVLPLIYLVISLWLPKSPIFLFKTGQTKEARKVLNRFARNTKKGYSSKNGHSVILKVSNPNIDTRRKT